MSRVAGPRLILHLDLDAFFTAVEQLHKPSLRGKPVVVGGVGGRGVVATASYEARVFGIGSAMSIAQARRRCPNAAYLSPRFGAYRAASELVMGLARELTPLVEQVSIDEAYLDLTPLHPGLDVEGCRELAQRLREQIRTRTGLTASVGAGTSKLVAKIHSDRAKPDGCLVVPPGIEAQTLAPLPVRALPGVGPATAARLALRGITTVGALASAGQEAAVELLGRAHGQLLHEFARGIDGRVVVPERDAKSVSAETTFPVDLTDRARLRGQLDQLAVRVAARLAGGALSGRTVVLKVRRHDFTTLTRSTTLDQPTDDVAVITRTAGRLLDALDVSDGLRLIGVGVSGLAEYVQPDLLADLLPQPGPLGEAQPGPLGEAPPWPEPDRPVAGPGRQWLPGQDVHHQVLGPGWVQGSGVGRVTVRFEGPGTPAGPVRTFAVQDPELAPADPPSWPPVAAAGSPEAVRGPRMQGCQPPEPQ